MSTLIFHGKVISGEGKGKKYLQLPWVRNQMQQKLGYTPYLGTLNISLDEESAQRRSLLMNADSAQICPAEGYCVGLIIKASIGTLECAVVLPQVEGYPKNILELVAPVYLRDALQVKDGDTVTVTVNL